MSALPFSIIATIAFLTMFLSFMTVCKYAIEDVFERTRITMTSFFVFIVTTLTVSFWPHTAETLPFAVPALLVGFFVGNAAGVRAAEERLRTEGIEYYMKHFAHIDVRTGTDLTWWTVINFYTIMGALVLINLVGLSTVIFPAATSWIITTSTLGAFLLGTIFPYLVHLWSIKAKHNKSDSTSEKENI